MGGGSYVERPKTAGQNVENLSGGPQDDNQCSEEEACNSFEGSRTCVLGDGDRIVMVVEGNFSDANEGGQDDNWINVDECVNSGEATQIGGQEGGETGGVAEDGNKFTDEGGGKAKSVKIGVQDGECQDTRPPSNEFLILLISFLFSKLKKTAYGFFIYVF